MPAAITDIRVADGTLVWAANEEPQHRYYRVYKDGRQVASTVATRLPVPGMTPDDAKRFVVKSVDKWGNM